MAFTDRLQHAWNAFMNKDPTSRYGNGPSYSVSPTRIRMTGGNERSIINSIYNRLALDTASIMIKHVKSDKNGKILEYVNSYLNECLNVSANIDQSHRSFIQDVVISMFDEGCVAIIPTETTLNPNVTLAYDITSMRTGKIVEWYPQKVKIRVYNENTGEKEDIILPKKMVGIIENPFYSVMNAPNSTLQRLIRKLVILDDIDEQSGSGKLDLIIQLPYTIRSEARKQQAEKRRKDIEMQLAGSKYGIAYVDSTEKVTQLNRSLENNLMKQIEYLTNLLFSQLGLTQSILDGTADEKTMVNYYNRTIEPIISAIVDEMNRKFLTKTARTQGHKIEFFRDPFKLLTAIEIAEIADKFIRGEIATSNEIRRLVGWLPSKESKADELRNTNLSEPTNKTTEKPIDEEKEVK